MRTETRRRSARVPGASLAVAALLAASAVAVGQDERPPQPADPVLARGQGSGWTNIEGFEAVGTLAAGGREMTFHLWRARDDRFRLELTHRGVRQLFVVDGSAGWIQIGSNPATELAAHQVWERLSWADVFARFPDFYRRYPRRELEPVSRFQGAAVRPVRLWPRSGYPYLYFLDEATGRVVGGIRHFYDGEDDAVREARLYYGDYREVTPGVFFAFTVESDEETYNQTLAVDEVRLSAEPPSAELFARDSGE
ncbi:MAG TPA: hypothetical protein VNB06_16105 [Thermoanaerobaculia bacterium]|nr:hypothetical protein [Thermoanaerobaculia bacterium]